MKVTAETMRWVADQADYIGRLARLPWAGDQANVTNILTETERLSSALTAAALYGVKPKRNRRTKEA